MPYLIIGGCALLALAVAAVGTWSLVSLGRDTPPSPSATRATTLLITQPSPGATIASQPTATPAPFGTLIPLVQPGPQATASPGAPGSPRPTAVSAEPASRAAQPTSRPAATPDQQLSAADGGRRGMTTYTVVAGDTLGKIAAQHGVSVQTLVQVNNLSDSTLLRVGQQLLIPPVDGVVYEVKAGDTVNAIARQFGVSAADLARQNGLDGNYTIRVGQQLLIPGVTGPVASPTLAATPAPTRAPVTPTSAPAAKPTSAPTQAPRPTSTAAAQPAPTEPPRPTSPPQPTPTAPPPSPRVSFEWPSMGTVLRGYSDDFRGIALAGAVGGPVMASAPGTVASATRSDNGAWHVLVDHGNGFATLYGNLGAIRVQPGDRVEKLQVLGTYGQIGNAPVQIYFELRQNGQPVDPRAYLPS